MRDLGSFIRDNLEAFAVAIAMALVIRHYCLEAFRIPTGSMKPSLYGDDAPRHGDRILVDKVVYQRRDPRRFEVAVFHYPLNHGKNFIKRIGGMPGEWLRLVDGDIWTSRDEGGTWTIARKPPGARDELFFGYYPVAPDARRAFESSGNWDAGSAWTVDEVGRRFAVDAGDVADSLVFRPRVLAYDDVDTSPGSSNPPEYPYVGDVRLSFEVAVARAGTLAVQITEHGVEHRLEIGAEGAFLETRGEREALELRLEAGSTHSVSFANVDDTLVVEFDGNVVERRHGPERTRPPSAKDFGGRWMEHRIRIDATTLAAELTGLSIERDVFYNALEVRRDARNGETNVYEWRIPEGHYFALGDNTQSSKDSRAWTIEVAELKDGGSVRWNPEEHPRNPRAEAPLGDTLVVPVDVDGIKRTIRVSDVVRWRRDVEAPLVPRRHLIGRAFAVFWPIYIPRIYTGPTRVKLIR